MSGWADLGPLPDEEATNRRLVLIREQADMIREWYADLEDPLDAYSGVFYFPRCNHTWAWVELKLLYPERIFECRRQCTRCFQVSDELEGRIRYAEGGRYPPYLQVNLESICEACWDIIGDLRRDDSDALKRDSENYQEIKRNTGKRTNAYLTHINSEKWRSIRHRVMARAGWVCEACLTNKATEVHHLNYLSLGDELCYDLRAVCSACHPKADEVRKRLR